jgi:hypothetical protein
MHLILYIILQFTNQIGNGQMPFNACFKLESKLHFRFYSIVQFQVSFSILSNCSPDTSKYNPSLWYSEPPTMFTGMLPGMPSTILLIPPDSPHPQGLKICYRVYSSDTQKYIPSTLQCTPWSTRSSTLPSMLSDTLPLQYNGTSQAYFPVQYCIHCGDSLTHNSEHGPKYTPNCPSQHTAGEHNILLKRNLSMIFQVHCVYTSKYTSQCILNYTSESGTKKSPDWC